MRHFILKLTFIFALFSLTSWTIDTKEVNPDLLINQLVNDADYRSAMNKTFANFDSCENRSEFITNYIEKELYNKYPQLKEMDSKDRVEVLLVAGKDIYDNMELYKFGGGCDDSSCNGGCHFCCVTTGIGGSGSCFRTHCGGSGRCR